MGRSRAIASNWMIAGALVGIFSAAGGVGVPHVHLGPPNHHGPSSLVEPGAQLERIATGYQFTEGPAVYRDGTLFFSDVYASEIHAIAPDGTVRRHRNYTGRGNGLYFDREWQLVACEMQYKRLSRDNLEGEVTTVVDSFAGAPLNAPNDLWIHPGGGIYFTDPDFATGGSASAVYYVPQPGGEMKRVIDDIALPNGLIGTPDGEALYVTDYSGVGTWRFAVGEDGALSDKQLLADIGGDGMTLDEEGNVYLAAGEVRVYDAQGNEVLSIEMPETPTNLTFGGPDGRTLYLTAGRSVYSLRMTVRGAFAPALEPTPTASPVPASPTPTPSELGHAIVMPIAHRE